MVTELGRLAGVNGEVYNFVFSRRVLTDSGGLQREAYLLRKPFLVLRKNTEWVELVEYNQVLLCDPDNLYEDKTLGWKPGNYVEGLFGDESALWRFAERIRLFIF